MESGSAIGTVISQSGEVTARSVDGQLRSLETGAGVYANEVVSTVGDAAVVIEFASGARKGMTGDSSITLEPALYEPQTAAVAGAAGDGAEPAAASAGAAEPIGEVTSAAGLVVARSADGSERELALGDPVFRGDTVYTDSGSLAVFRFADGSRKGLGSNAEYRFDGVPETAPAVADETVQLASETQVAPVTAETAAEAAGPAAAAAGADLGTAEDLAQTDASVPAAGDSAPMLEPAELPAPAAGGDIVPAAAAEAGAGAPAQPAAAGIDEAGTELAMLDDEAGGEADAAAASSGQPVESGAADAVTAETVGSLSGAIGDVRAVSTGGEERLLQAGDAIHAGDTILTGEQGVAVLSFGELGVRGLSSNGSLAVDDYLASAASAGPAAVDEIPETAMEVGEEAPASELADAAPVAGADADAVQQDPEPATEAEAAAGDMAEEDTDEAIGDAGLSLAEAQQASAALIEADETDEAAAVDDGGLPAAEGAGADAAVIASVSGASGEVIAVSASGAERQLATGDAVYAGERILTGPDGIVVLDNGAGDVRGLAGNAELAVDTLAAAPVTEPEPADVQVADPDSAADAATESVAALAEEPVDEAAVVAEATDAVDEEAATEGLAAVEPEPAAAAAPETPAGLDTEIEEAGAVADMAEEPAGDIAAADEAGEFQPPGPQLGVLSSAMGEVEASSDAGVRQLEPGDAVFAGEQLQVSEGGVAILHLEDGRPLGVSGGSTLDLNADLLHADSGDLAEAEAQLADDAPENAETAAGSEYAAVDADELAPAAEDVEAAGPDVAAAEPEPEPVADAETAEVDAAESTVTMAAGEPDVEAGSASGGAAAAAIGSVSAMSGHVVAIDAAGNERPLEVGDELYAGETVTTDAASTVIVQLNDGQARGIAGASQLRLDPVPGGSVEPVLEASPEAGAEDPGADSMQLQATAVDDAADDATLESLSEEVVEAALAEVGGRDDVEVTAVDVAPELGADSAAGDAAALPMGRLVSSLGEVRAISADGESRLLEVGDEIYPDETLVTDSFGVATVELVDGSFRGISSDASLRLDESLLRAPATGADEGDAAIEADAALADVSDAASDVAASAEQAPAETVADADTGESAMRVADSAPDAGGDAVNAADGVEPGTAGEAVAEFEAVQAEVGPESAGDAIATVSSLVGEVQAQNHSGDVRELSAGDELYPGDVVLTGDLSTAVVEFADGGQRGLTSNAEMQVESGRIQLADAGRPTAEAEAPPTAHVAEVEGDVWASGTGGDARSLNEGDPLYAGEQITTGADGRVVVDVAGGEVRELAAEQAYELPSAQVGTRVEPVHAGTVSAATGELRAIAADGSERSLAPGDPVFSGDRLETGDVGTAVIVLNDGSVRGLASGAEMELPVAPIEPVAELSPDSATVAQADVVEPAMVEDLGEGLMVGAVSAASGTVLARAVDGSERELQAGDAVYEGETIWTEAGSTVVIAMQDGTSKGLAGASVLRLDGDSIDLDAIQAAVEDQELAFGAVAPAGQPVDDSEAAGNRDAALEMSAMEDVNALQDAILAGADPSEEAEASAAGWETISEGTHEAVFIERSSQRTTPDKGDPDLTGGAGAASGLAGLSEPDDVLAPTGTEVGAPSGGGGSEGGTTLDDLINELLDTLQMTLAELQSLLLQNSLTFNQFATMSSAQQQAMLADFRAEQQSFEQPAAAEPEVAEPDGEPQQEPSPIDLSIGAPLFVASGDAPTFASSTPSDGRADEPASADNRITNVLSEDGISLSFEGEDFIPGTTPSNVPSNLLAEQLIVEFDAPEGEHDDPIVFNLNDSETETFLIHNFHAEDGDILKVHDLLLGEGLDANQSTDVDVLAGYLHFDYDQASQSTRILVGHDENGDFVTDHTIVLDQVDLTSSGSLDDATIIGNLLASNNLDVATAQSAPPDSNSFNLLDVTPGVDFLS